ncbi:MAG TPA: MmgE/PrpD family protein [Actinomycetota bacterium]
MTTLVERLASFAAATTAATLPDEVRASVRQRVLDIVGVSLAALTLDTSSAVIAHALEQGGTAQARAIGVGERLPAASAAFVNGVLAHSLDYDDTHLPSILHPSASIVPASLAAAEASGASGAETIAAIAAGLEICVRLGMAGYDPVVGNSLFFERGQHATSICGAVAGAASAAKLLGLDAEGIAHAMGIAVSMGSGVIEANRAGGTVKRLHCGIAARSAVDAALLARRGFTGPPTALEGRFGFFQAWLDGRFDEAPLRDGLGERWEVPRIFFKPYPANHFTHAGIDAAIAVRASSVAPDDIESIRLGVATPTVRTIGEPIEAKRAPATGYLAQFSGPYTVVAALLGGSGLGLGLDDFTDALAHDPRRCALMALVDVVADRECDAIYPMQFPAILRVRTRDDRELLERVMTNRGGPDRPLSDDELRIKFRDNALRVLDEQTASEIADACAGLDDLASVEQLLAPTANAKKE